MSTHDPRDAGLGDRLSGSIHDHVDHLPAGHVTVHDVRRRAGRIRRNRRIAMAAAGAAVAAVVVPAALLVVPRPAGDDAPAPVATGSASPTAATGPVDVVLPADPRPGDAPRVAWMTDDTLHLADGSEQQADRFYEQFVQVGPRLLGSYGDDQGNRFLDIDDGEAVSTVPITDAPVISRDGTMAAWGEPDGTVTVTSEDGTTDLGRQPGPVAPVALTGDPRCEPDEASSCAVYLAPDGEGPPSVVTSSGQSGPLTGVVAVGDVDGPLLAAQTSYTNGRACSALVDTSTGDHRWDTCEHALGRFSPDGRHLLAVPSDTDGMGPGTVSVLATETGSTVAAYTVEQGFVAAQTWEDDEHLLLVRYSYATGSWDVVRVDLAGEVERVAGPIDNDDEFARPFSLAGNR